MRKLLHLIFMCVGLMVTMSCSNKTQETTQETTPATTQDKSVDILLQPYDFTQEEAESLIPLIKEGIGKVYKVDLKSIKVLPSKSLPESAYHASRDRYIASKLLKDLPAPSIHEHVIGLTHKDISDSIHGFDNYGIMGLSYLKSRKSVASDHRPKGQKEFVAVIVHEFGHGFFGATHCQDPKCIMCEYKYHKGKPHRFRLCKEHEFMGR